MRHPLVTRVVLGATLTVALAGCGVGATSTPPAQTLTAATSHGLAYALRVTSTGSQVCVDSTYRSPQPSGPPVGETSHLCGSAPGPGRPALVQAHTSSESLVTDVSASGCGAVRAGPSHRDLHPLVTRCTTGKPTFRVTILPKAHRLVIVGIPGAPVVNFPRHVCRVGICVKPLA